MHLANWQRFHAGYAKYTLPDFEQSPVLKVSCIIQTEPQAQGCNVYKDEFANYLADMSREPDESKPILSLEFSVDLMQRFKLLPMSTLKTFDAQNTNPLFRFFVLDLCLERLQFFPLVLQLVPWDVQSESQKLRQEGLLNATRITNISYQCTHTKSQHVEVSQCIPLFSSNLFEVAPRLPTVLMPYFFCHANRSMYVLQPFKKCC
jgi:hypothetical protein